MNWQYTFIQVDPHTMEKLANSGENGWECVCCFRFPDSSLDYLLLKRPKYEAWWMKPAGTTQLQGHDSSPLPALRESGP